MRCRARPVTRRRHRRRRAIADRASVKIMAEVDRQVSRISAVRLTEFIAAAYRAAGIPTADAAKAAELMARSDISGADGHGVFRLPQYIRRIKAGGLNIT